MKIKRQISVKATKRFKMMVLASMALLAVSYLSDDISNDMIDYMWFVDAAEDESADTSYDITINDVENLKAYQINRTSSGG